MLRRAAERGTCLLFEPQHPVVKVQLGLHDPGGIVSYIQGPPSLQQEPAIKTAEPLADGRERADVGRAHVM